MDVVEWPVRVTSVALIVSRSLPVCLQLQTFRCIALTDANVPEGDMSFEIAISL